MSENFTKFALFRYRNNLPSKPNNKLKESFRIIMSPQSFYDYLNDLFPSRGSQAANSYRKAISILDEIFRQRDIFNLNDIPLSEIRDPYLIARIIDFVAEEEDKFRQETPSIFDFGKPNQTSYPRNRFCTAAIRKLGEYITKTCGDVATEIMMDSTNTGDYLSLNLMKRFRINNKGTEREIMTKQRVGQQIFRAMLLEIYDNKCCLTGIEVPEVLRASHIIPWAECVKTRLNPENGLCLSATYDAAFDKHLITLDEDYRLVLSPILKETYTSDAFRTHFLKFEGKAISLPFKYLPSLEFLSKHREKLIV